MVQFSEEELVRLKALIQSGQAVNKGELEMEEDCGAALLIQLDQVILDGILKKVEEDKVGIGSIISEYESIQQVVEVSLSYMWDRRNDSEGNEWSYIRDCVGVEDADLRETFLLLGYEEEEESVEDMEDCLEEFPDDETEDDREDYACPDCGSHKLPVRYGRDLVCPDCCVVQSTDCVGVQ